MPFTLAPLRCYRRLGRRHRLYWGSHRLGSLRHFLCRLSESTTVPARQRCMHHLIQLAQGPRGSGDCLRFCAPHFCEVCLHALHGLTLGPLSGSERVAPIRAYPSRGWLTHRRAPTLLELDGLDSQTYRDTRCAAGMPPDERSRCVISEVIRSRGCRGYGLQAVCTRSACRKNRLLRRRKRVVAR